MDKITNDGRYTFKNVLLETGFEYDGDEVVKTKTALFCVEIADGKITVITPNDPALDAIDAKGWLMLPAFKDMHAHLDKMLYGLPWQAVSGQRRTVKDQIAYEQKMIPEWLKTSIERTEKLVNFLQSNGTHFIRSHFNIDPTSGFESLKHLEIALKNKERTVGAELVAFPQHGLFYTNTAPLLKEVVKMNIDFIGGVDPYSIDGSIEKPMELITQLAIDHHKGIDIHLHEAGETGVKTIEYLINKANENPVLRGKSFVSHAFALGHLSPLEAERMAARLAEAGVGIVSSVPFGNTIMPIPLLRKHGVEVLVGNDNIQDHWSTFGPGHMLRKAKLIASLYGYSSEWALSRTLGFATRYLLPLDDKGNQQWPKAGNEANLVFMEASCSAEVVARVSPVKSLVHKGNIVF
ncbi:cytosine/adenosine deaminase-related metal-dependent hydrolase [Chitinophaga polysaccharea]|uniref:Cytosine/adenosine deaminase-related metal-dependent hydrolase n=1 Tax=Chitinophaga polysaccharea TaxID=1293035 RepID=A0A561P3V3_9BACT|nr:amidohydrolase [Chitinophaga polysaccharea]TWF32789.1 cytosine/adenosine deaminase-related metal-dependent hydrolase [Chitinophaga polysaccharea]